METAGLWVDTARGLLRVEEIAQLRTDGRWVMGGTRWCDSEGAIAVPMWESATNEAAESSRIGFLHKVDEVLRNGDASGVIHHLDDDRFGFTTF